MKVSAVQLYLNDRRTKAQTVDYALSMMDRCRGSDLIVLPELWNIGFGAFDDYHKECEPMDGPTMTAVAAKARELGAWVCGGSFVESRDGKLYNTSALFDRDGRMVSHYSKMHLFTYKSREAELLSPGEELSVVDTEFGRAGLAICYDLRFPEIFRAMVDMGAEMFLISSCWVYPRINAWEIFCRARAAENMAWLFASNAAGAQRGILYMGRSKIVDPWGTVIADTDHHEGIVSAEIDVRAVSRMRAEFPVLGDRRYKS